MHFCDIGRRGHAVWGAGANFAANSGRRWKVFAALAAGGCARGLRSAIRSA